MSQLNDGLSQSNGRSIQNINVNYLSDTCFALVYVSENFRKFNQR